MLAVKKETYSHIFIQVDKGKIIIEEIRIIKRGGGYGTLSSRPNKTVATLNQSW